MIPKIDVRSLLAKKMYEGELVFDYEPESDVLDIPLVEFACPVHAELRYEIFEDNSVEVKGSLYFTLKGECSRCLAPAEQRFEGEVEGLFVPGTGDGVTYGYTHVIVLHELLRDALMFALPPRVLCGECVDPE